MTTTKSPTEGFSPAERAAFDNWKPANEAQGAQMLDLMGRYARATDEAVRAELYEQLESIKPATMRNPLAPLRS